MILLAIVVLGAWTAVSCGTLEGGLNDDTARLRLTVTMEDGSPLPGPDDPQLAVDMGSNPTRVRVSVEALRANGAIDTRFNGYVRLSVHPGGIDRLEGEDVVGRSVLLRDGVTTGEHVVQIGGAYGVTRLWAEDVGYVPADPTKSPACANGRDDDDNGYQDYPAEPGCAFANDDTESGGSYSAGVSEPLRFALPRVGQVQGYGTKTPFSNQQVEVSAADPVRLVVTRVSSDGFYVTDISPDIESDKRNYYTGLFAFNFNTPWGMRVCDRVVYLSGTVSEFYGYTELGYPSFKLDRWYPGEGACEVPDPALIDDTLLLGSDAASSALEPLESGLVRIRNARIGRHFGPDHVVDNAPGDNASNCDLNDDGKLDFDTPGNPEMLCSNACFLDPECVDWTSYQSRGNVRLVVGASNLGIMMNAATVTGFDAHKVKTSIAIKAVTGTLRHFSGGDLNWTLETRCTEDLVHVPCSYTNPGDRPTTLAELKACADQAPELPPIGETCVQPRTDYDPDEETN